MAVFTLTSHTAPRALLTKPEAARGQLQTRQKESTHSNFPLHCVQLSQRRTLPLASPPQTHVARTDPAHLRNATYCQTSCLLCEPVARVSSEVQEKHGHGGHHIDLPRAQLCRSRDPGPENAPREPCSTAAPFHVQRTWLRCRSRTRAAHAHAQQCDKTTMPRARALHLRFTASCTSRAVRTFYRVCRQRAAPGAQEEPQLAMHLPDR